MKIQEGGHGPFDSLCRRLCPCPLSMFITDFIRSFVCSIFILLLRERDGCAIFWTNPHQLRSCPFSSFPVVPLTSYHWICCLFEATKQR